MKRTAAFKVAEAADALRDWLAAQPAKPHRALDLPHKSPNAVASKELTEALAAISRTRPGTDKQTDADVGSTESRPGVERREPHLRPQVTDQARRSARVSAASDARVWEDELRTTLNTAPVLSVEGFEGPLDWLLEMARAQKIDLAKLPILALIQSFANALEAALDRPGGGGSPLARWGDWTVMAASLTELRSRLLLPHDSPEAKQAHRDAEAVRRFLLTREQMRAADWFDHQPQIGRDVFARVWRRRTAPIASVTWRIYSGLVWFFCVCPKRRRRLSARGRRHSGALPTPWRKSKSFWVRGRRAVF